MQNEVTMKATLRQSMTSVLVLLMLVLALPAQAERTLLDQVVAIVDDDVPAHQSETPEPRVLLDPRVLAGYARALLHLPDR